MVTLRLLKCKNCGHEWFPRKVDPMYCPRCRVTISEKGRKHKSEYYRNHYLGTMVDGKFTMIKTLRKRAISDCCEVCGNRPKKLAYHHWDDNDFSKGTWLCSPCHFGAEASDKGFVAKYLELKSQINAGLT